MCSVSRPSADEVCVDNHQTVTAMSTTTVLVTRRLSRPVGPLVPPSRGARGHTLSLVVGTRLLGRDEERVGTGCVAIEVHAVWTENEHQVRDGPKNCRVTRFGAAQGALGAASPLALSDKRSNERELRDENRDRANDVGPVS